jgi:periplasmic copper chaperone A
MKKAWASGHSVALALVVAIALIVAACGGSDSSSVAIDDAWARTSASAQTTGVVYMTINGGNEDDRLVSASVPADVAASVELHETVMADKSGDAMETDAMETDAMNTDAMETDAMGTDGMASDDAMGGQMAMRQVDGIEVPAGSTVTLGPGGLHIMLLDLAQPLPTGSTFDLTLDFEKAGEQTVEVSVRDA